jgi:hypothetical protein
MNFQLFDRTYFFVLLILSLIALALALNEVKLSATYFCRKRK